MQLQANEATASAEAAEDGVECSCRLMRWQQQQGPVWNADAGYSDGTCNSRSYTRWCGRLLQTKEVAHQQQDPTGDDEECSCRLMMWQQQQKNQDQRGMLL